MEVRTWTRVAGEGQLSRQGERLPSLCREPALSEAFARRDVSGLGRGAPSGAQRRRSMPTRLAVGSNRILWWRCRRGHEWQARVFARTGGSGCPVCARTRVPTKRSLAARFPALAEELHPDRNKGSNRRSWPAAQIGWCGGVAAVGTNGGPGIGPGSRQRLPALLSGAPLGWQPS